MSFARPLCMHTGIFPNLLQFSKHCSLALARNFCKITEQWTEDVIGRHTYTYPQKFCWCRQNRWKLTPWSWSSRPLELIQTNLGCGTTLSISCFHLTYLPETMTSSVGWLSSTTRQLFKVRPISECDVIWRWHATHFKLLCMTIKCLWLRPASSWYA